MENRKKSQRLTREIEVEVIRGAEGGETRFSASLSSEAPYKRWFGTEILDHSSDAVDLARAAGGLPLLFGHDPDAIVGRVENVRIDGRRLRGDLRFFSTDRAQEVATLVSEGHREMSVGYTIERMRLEAEDGEDKTYRATRWALLEASVVGVPADASVGIGRSAEVDQGEMPPVEPAGVAEPETISVTRAAEPAAPIATQGVVMTTETTAPAASQVPDIIALGERYSHLGGDKVAAEYLRSGKTDLGEFQAHLLERVGTKGSETASDLGMSARERGRFSVVRLVRALANPSDRRAREDAAFEFEASEAALQAQGRSLRGNAQATIPLDILHRDLLAGTATIGGNLVATDLLAGSFIDVLRARALTVQAGATVLSGLQGAIAIPSKTAGATAYWVAEGTAPTEGAITFGQVTMSPKTLGAYVDFSRKLMLQSSVDVEMMVRNDLYGSLGVEIDRVVLNGAGTGSEPAGILASTAAGTTTLGAQGGAPTWAMVVDMETNVANGNADLGALAYFVNSRVRGKLKTVAKSTAVTDFIWEPNNTMNGYRVFVSNNIPNTLTKGTTTGLSGALFGNMSDVILGQWGGMDLLVDPFTASNTGTVRVVALQDVDVAVRRAASFSHVKEISTT